MFTINYDAPLGPEATAILTPSLELPSTAATDAKETGLLDTVATPPNRKEDSL